MAQLGPALALPLLEYGLTVYHLHVRGADGSQVLHRLRRSACPARLTTAAGLQAVRCPRPPSSLNCLPRLQVELLQRLRPDVVLTCLQTAHGAALSGDLLQAALHSALGYAPRVVHCAAEDLQGVWADMQVGGVGGWCAGSWWERVCTPAVACSAGAWGTCCRHVFTWMPGCNHRLQAVADGLGESEKGRQLVAAQRQQLEAAAGSARGRGSQRVCCIQWPQPLYACGAWVPELVQVRGCGADGPDLGWCPIV